MEQAKTTLKMDDTGTFPSVQISYMSITDDATPIAQYGTHGSPPVGTPCLVLTVGGDEGNKYVIPLSVENRPQLEEDEFVTGNFKVGSTVLFDKNGNIVIKSNKKVEVEATEITINGNVTVTGDVVADGISLKTHTHSVSVPSTPYIGSTGAPS